MISFVVVSVVLLTKAVCHLTVGPGVCKRDQMSKANNNSQQETTFCCEGYKEKNDICVDCPDCTSMICPENYCGDTCIEMCDCPLNAYCDRRFCCRCKPGLHGVFCNETCAQGYYGPRCKHKCMCKRHEKCDSGTGNCTSNSSNTSNTSTICKPGTASHNNMDSCADSNNSNSLLHDDKSVTSGVMHIGYIVFIVAVSVGTFVFTFLSIYAKILQKIKVRHRKRNDSSMKKATI